MIERPSTLPEFVRKELALAHRKQPPKFPEGGTTPRLQQKHQGPRSKPGQQSLQPTIPATLPAAPTEKKQLKLKPTAKKAAAQEIEFQRELNNNVQACRTSLLASVDRF
jgi:hypothetical protein